MDFSAPGMPEGMAQLLARKYAIMQQQADAGTISANAGANAANAGAKLDLTKAKLLPGESEANIGLTKAQAGLAGAQSRFTGVQADWFGKTAQSQLDLNKANVGYLGAQTDTLRDDLTMLPGTTKPATTPTITIGGRRMPMWPSLLDGGRSW